MYTYSNNYKTPSYYRSPEQMHYVHSHGFRKHARVFADRYNVTTLQITQLFSSQIWLLTHQYITHVFKIIVRFGENIYDHEFKSSRPCQLEYFIVKEIRFYITLDNCGRFIAFFFALTSFFHSPPFCCLGSNVDCKR